MLEKLPRAVGSALSGIRSGLEKIAAFSDLNDLPETIRLASQAFGNGEAIPTRYTADGMGISPPVQWLSIPKEAASLVLLVEDADAPSPEPLVHCIVVGLPPQDGGLGEGALTEAASRAGLCLGKNSFLKSEWLPPDPPPGHGQHRYVFQIFALGAASAFGAHPGRGEVIDHVRKHGIGKGVLIGTYQRS